MSFHYENENIATPELIGKTVTVMAENKNRTHSAVVTVGTISTVTLTETGTLQIAFYGGTTISYDIFCYLVQAHTISTTQPEQKIPYYFPVTDITGKWTHYKNNTYEVLGKTINQTTGEEEILYLAHGELVSRNAAEFFDSNTPEGKPRFVKN